MNDRGQAAWTRCEMAIWAIMETWPSGAGDEDVIHSLEDRLRDMANRMLPLQLERMAEQWEEVVAKRESQR